MRYWLLLLLVTVTAQFGYTAELSTSHQEINFFDNTRERPVKTYLWFPNSECDSQKYCIAEKARVNTPIILSHGAMGSPLEYSWLAEALAKDGYIVVGVAHFGESWVYGADTVRPQTVAQFWLRTADIRYVLNTLAKNNPFDRSIDWQNTTGIGHSAGGQTMLALACAQFSASHIANYCQSDAALIDKGCGYGRGIEPSAAFTQAYSGNYRDDRISQVIALDPALGAAATEQSLTNIQLPTLIIGAKNNDFLPFTAHSARYAEFIPTSKLIGLAGNAGHFVFLNPCEHNYQAQGVALCKDAAGVDRRQVHRTMISHVLRFLESSSF